MRLISTTMALQSLKDQVSEVDDLVAKLEAERAIRDDLIRDAISARVPYLELVRITGLSRNRLVTIGNSPSNGV